MPLEIERKFLVNGSGWKPVNRTIAMKQGYLAVGPPASVRIRLEGDTAKLNIKRSTLELSREEYEYDIPPVEAREMLDRLCNGRLVEKTRHVVEFSEKCWEVDVFEGRNEGLVVAEIELGSEDETFEHPPWLGEEITGDPRYLNSSLSLRPYTEWK